MLPLITFREHTHCVTPTLIHARTHAHARTHTHKHTRKHAHAHTHHTTHNTHTHTHSYICIYIYICIHVYTYICYPIGEVGGWGRDPEKCTGRGWGMGSSTIQWALRPVLKYHLRWGVGLIKFLKMVLDPSPPPLATAWLLLSILCRYITTFICHYRTTSAPE